MLKIFTQGGGAIGIPHGSHTRVWAHTPKQRQVLVIQVQVGQPPVGPVIGVTLLLQMGSGCTFGYSDRG